MENNLQSLKDRFIENSLRSMESDLPRPHESNEELEKYVKNSLSQGFGIQFDNTIASFLDTLSDFNLYDLPFNKMVEIVQELNVCRNPAELSEEAQKMLRFLSRCNDLMYLIGGGQ